MSRSEAWRRLFPAARRLLFGGARQPKARRASEAGTPTTSDYYAGMNEDYRWFRQDELVRRCIVTNAYFSTLTAGFDTIIEPTNSDVDPEDYGYVKDEVNYYNRLRNSTTPVSRASAINFLDKMTEEGFLDYRETTTKGGWKRIYRPSRIAPDEEGFRRALAGRIFDRVRTELLGEEEIHRRHLRRPTKAPPSKDPSTGTEGRPTNPQRRRMSVSY